jgi:hypothetical protein
MTVLLEKFVQTKDGLRGIPHPVWDFSTIY